LLLNVGPRGGLVGPLTLLLLLLLNVGPRGGLVGPLTLLLLLLLLNVGPRGGLVGPLTLLLLLLLNLRLRGLRGPLRALRLRLGSRFALFFVLFPLLRLSLLLLRSLSDLGHDRRGRGQGSIIPLSGESLVDEK
jgi:hypothetical protein